MSDDTISRRAAIEAICKACSMEGDYHKCDGYPETSTWCDELVALRALPSAQPELPENWWKTDHGYMWLCPECGLEVHSDYDRCVRCGWERRADE